MYENVHKELKKVRRQIESTSYKMIEAEGKEYHKLMDKLERLETKLEQLQTFADELNNVSKFNE